ncbi:MAG: LysM peptidoglycan-binding domain-containing protein [Calditrichaeota bacterium]|nr:MAG: LysM peptidoglycan-binding domain-containing protein [Calditrichota bacterium]
MPPGRYRLEIKGKALQKRQFARTRPIAISVAGGEEKWLAISLARRTALWASATLAPEGNGSFWGRGDTPGATLAVSARPVHSPEKKPRPRIVPVQNVQPQVRYYTVQPGDWLSTIAEHFYGDASKYELLLHANKDKIKDPNLIYPGQRLRIPVLESETQFGAPAASE